ncbi:phosphoribosylamine--glycine ligase [Waterburya agarophytonicola K14]|uniref:Phosphoribosylamine--glycine ligase n=1 Tax=Waterburya agarophytonicola KI4 TaxID=2874699 RepID=A0A964BUI5_9CYAN|nr:phosphoribosylamine--glycine ligase [Waterburya agarophytonicola]MCC0178763.1 phosphoribosylamine--glycine ligase [Waterburya agarophytonicola KI4]
MKVLVVGGGGREHALAWTLLQSDRVEEVFCSPGNGGTATMKNCKNIPLAVDDFVGAIDTVKKYKINLVVVGPEVPLSLGIVDRLRQEKIAVFGPTQAGAQIESSKSWAKEIMTLANVPTAKSQTFSDANSAQEYIQTQGAPIVIKADGLAAGKGVIVAMTLVEAIAAVDELLGDKPGKLVIEEYLTGSEVSVLAVTDGKTIRPLSPAQDHKRIGEGDTGKNTGGMGAYSPVPLVSDELMARIETEVLQPTLKALNQKNIDYRGVLYAGLMITPQGEPKVIEFNCRFGDPETQVVLPLLNTPLEEILIACVEQKLEQLPPIKYKAGSAVCVVVASGGYPDAYESGKAIAGIESAEQKGAIVFHAGTKLERDRVITSGGRVLGITAIGDNFDRAIASAYDALESIEFDKMYYRHDIGHKYR